MKQLVLAVLVLAAPVAAQEKPFDWKLRPEVGSKWRVKNHIRVTTAQNVLRTQYKKRITQTAVLDYEVLSRDSDGAVTASLIYRDFATKVESSATGAYKGNQLSSFLQERDRGYRGAKFILKIGTKGEIWNVHGWDEFWRKPSRNIPVFISGSADDIDFIPHEGFSELAGVPNPLPSFPLSTGNADSYAFKAYDGLHAGMNSHGVVMVIDTFGTRTLKSLQDTTATFEESGNFSFTVQEPSSFQKSRTRPSNFSGVLNGVMKGSTKVDESTGITTEFIRNIRYHGHVVPGSMIAGKLIAVPFWILRESCTVLESRS